MLVIRSLGTFYRKRRILIDIDMDLKTGEVLSLVGPNGAGKTTLLKCCVGILTPGEGTICIDDQDVTCLNGNTRARRIGYMPQSSPSRFPMTVFDTVLMGRRSHMAWNPSRHDLEIVETLINAMNINHIAFRNFDHLSGGEQQKVLLARAFAQEAAYILLDEPTSNLDLKHQFELMDMVARMAATESRGVMVAMHDLNLASRYSHRIAMLSGGRICFVGTPFEVLTPDIIKDVYGVTVTVTRVNGHPYIMPSTHIITDRRSNT
ncbi:MAG: ABC transporter ATP-binding protein [Syntrophales bacterium]|jgi:iron complex transport system ATP-binding protein|nr:ABC transporter ATP-binding protein [Syntrophales bacterium]MDY0043716.1 ABC transporter ATP-binding protein [Syntrophales bacterium]